jgi:hypothetical protein
VFFNVKVKDILTCLILKALKVILKEILNIIIIIVSYAY